MLIIAGVDGDFKWFLDQLRMLLPVSVLGLDKTGTRFLGGHRFEPVVFGGRSLVHAARPKFRKAMQFKKVDLRTLIQCFQWFCGDFCVSKIKGISSYLHAVSHILTAFWRKFWRKKLTSEI